MLFAEFLEAGDQFATTGRPGQHPLAGDLAEATQPRAEPQVVLGILWIALFQLPQGLVDVLPQQDRRAIGEQGEALRIGRVHLEAEAAGKFRVGDYFRPQYAHHEGAGVGPGAGKQLLGNAGAADHAAALGDQHFLAGPRQLVGSDETVVAATDNDGVVAGAGGWIGIAHGAMSWRLGGNLVGWSQRTGLVFVVSPMVSSTGSSIRRSRKAPLSRRASIAWAAR